MTIGMFVGIFLLTGLVMYAVGLTAYYAMQTPETPDEMPASTPPTPAKFTPRRVDLDNVEKIKYMSVDGYQYEDGKPRLNEAEGFMRDYYDPKKTGKR